MSSGTRFTTKDGLISSIIKKIYTNTKFEVSADKIQTAIRDVVESLWDKRPNILTITDANISQYYSEVDGYGSQLTVPILTIPVETDILMFNTVVNINLFGIRMTGDYYNGKKLKISGNVRFWQPVEAALGISGRMSRYYYTNTYYTYYMDEAFAEFVWWNGTWYGDWY